MRRTNRWFLISATVAAGGLALSGCSGGGGGPSESSGPQTVVIYGPDTGTEATELEASWADWADQNNITIEYDGDKDFTTNIATKIQANALPDIGMFPQPGLLNAAIQTGTVVKLDDAAKSNVQQNFSEDWQGYVTSDGDLYATPMDASVKGYVWYRPADFQKWGVEVPTTYQELLDLTAKIQQATGNPPWCAGFNAGTTSGWPGADQLAEVVLGFSGPDVYDGWVKGDTKFTDQPIDDAFTQLGKILQDPKYVNAGFGDIASINSTAFGDVAAKVADGECALTNQATFLEASFATTKTESGATPTVGEDGDIWAFPLPAEQSGQNAVTGGGDFAAAFNDNDATMKVMEYLSSADWANSLISVENASFISANKGLDASKEKDPLLQDAIRILQDEKTVFRFGADDAMPNVVETAFWAGIVAWINGTPQEEVEQQMQAAWASAG